MLAYQFTMWLEWYAIPTEGAEQVALSLVEGFKAQIGCPLHIYSEQGRNFMSKLFYKHCANGQKERYNRTLFQSSCCCLRNKCFQWYWHQNLQLIVGTMKATENRKTGFTYIKMTLRREITVESILFVMIVGSQNFHG